LTKVIDLYRQRAAGSERGRDLQRRVQLSTFSPRGIVSPFSSPARPPKWQGLSLVDIAQRI
jgi:hypothetical protein